MQLAFPAASGDADSAGHDAYTTDYSDTDEHALALASVARDALSDNDLPVSESSVLDDAAARHHIAALIMQCLVRRFLAVKRVARIRATLALAASPRYSSYEDEYDNDFDE